MQHDHFKGRVRALSPVTLQRKVFPQPFSKLNSGRKIDTDRRLIMHCVFNKV